MPTIRFKSLILLGILLGSLLGGLVSPPREVKADPLFSDDFESGFGDWADTGTENTPPADMSIVTTEAHSPTHSVLADGGDMENITPFSGTWEFTASKWFKPTNASSVDLDVSMSVYGADFWANTVFEVYNYNSTHWEIRTQFINEIEYQYLEIPADCGWTEMVYTVETDSTLHPYVVNSYLNGTVISAMSGTSIYNFTDPDPFTLIEMWDAETYIDDVSVSLIEYDLVIEAPDGTGYTVPGTGTHTYTKGENATITAYPGSGWTLLYWDIDGTHYTSSSLIITMTADTTAKAYFSRGIYGMEGEYSEWVLDSYCDTTGSIGSGVNFFYIDNEGVIRANVFNAYTGPFYLVIENGVITYESDDDFSQDTAFNYAPLNSVGYKYGVTRFSNSTGDDFVRVWGDGGGTLIDSWCPADDVTGFNDDFEVVTISPNGKYIGVWEASGPLVAVYRGVGQDPLGWFVQVYAPPQYQQYVEPQAYSINLRRYENLTVVADPYTATIVNLNGTITFLTVSGDDTGYVGSIFAFTYPLLEGNTTRTLYYPTATITPLVPGPVSDVYLFTILDLTGYLSTHPSILEAYSTISNATYVLDSQNVGNSVNGVNLRLTRNVLVNLRLNLGNATYYEFGTFYPAGSPLTHTLIFSYIGTENTMRLINSVISASAVRSPDTEIDVSYTNTLTGYLFSANATIYLRNGTLVTSQASSLNVDTFTFNGLTNTTDYFVVLTIEHEYFDTDINRNWAFDGAFSSGVLVPDFTSLGWSVPVSNLIGTVLLLFVAGTFSFASAPLGIVFTVLLAGVFTYTEILVVPVALLTLAFCLGIIFVISRRVN